jgi:hypothetical protein
VKWLTYEKRFNSWIDSEWIRRIEVENSQIFVTEDVRSFKRVRFSDNIEYIENESIDEEIDSSSVVGNEVDQELENENTEGSSTSYTPKRVRFSKVNPNVRDHRYALTPSKKTRVYFDQEDNQEKENVEVAAVSSSSSTPKRARFPENSQNIKVNRQQVHRYALTPSKNTLIYFDQEDDQEKENVEGSSSSSSLKRVRFTETSQSIEDNRQQDQRYSLVPSKKTIIYFDKDTNDKNHEDLITDNEQEKP